MYSTLYIVKGTFYYIMVTFALVPIIFNIIGLFAYGVHITHF